VAAGGPVLQPVGTIDLVLVEQVSQTFRELVAFTQVRVVRQKALQWLEVRLINELRKQAHQAPSEWGFIEQGRGGDFVTTQDHAIELPHEAAGELNIDRGSDSAAAHVAVFWVFRQGQFEPLGNAVALYQGNFVFQGSQWVAAHPAHHQAA